MESQILKSTNNKRKIVCLLLSVMCLQGFSQNKLVALASSIKYEFALPVICVIGFGLFMLSVFIKQKDH